MLDPQPVLCKGVLRMRKRRQSKRGSREATATPCELSYAETEKADALMLIGTHYIIKTHLLEFVEL